MPKYLVFDRAGDAQYHVSPHKARRMVAGGQAEIMHGNALRLLGPTQEQEHPCRTHTSRGGLMAAIGRSQLYTTAKRGRPATTEHKKIFPEDRPAYVAAVLDHLVEVPRGLFVFSLAHEWRSPDHRRS